MFDGAMSGAIGGLIGGTCVVIILWIVGLTAKVEKALATPPTDLITILFPQKPEDVYRLICEFAQKSKITIEHWDPSAGLLVLGERMGITKFHNGYWLFIYIYRVPDGTSDVRIGIKSRAYQYAFALNMNRKKLIERIEIAVNGQKGKSF